MINYTIIKSTRIVLVLLIGAITGLAACDSTFLDPFENGDRFYTIYGFIDASQFQHSVRVIPVTRFREVINHPSEDQGSIDAVVTSTDLLTGTVTRWLHSVELLDNGTYGHIFRAKFLVRPGRTYRLEVLRSDGITATAETTVPRFPVTVPDPATLFFPYESSPDSAGFSREIYVPDIASPWDIIITYDLQGTFVRLPYGRPGSRTSDGGWRFTIDMGADAPRMREYMEIPASAPLPLLHAIFLQIRALDANWDPPNGVFDPEILSQPGILSNVVNGYGLWGSVALYQYTWIAPPGAGN